MAQQNDIAVCPQDSSTVPLKRLKNIVPFVSKILIGLICVIFCITAFQLIGFANVKGLSMYPSIQEGDFIIYRRNIDTIQRGDIVIFSEPGKPDMVKRVIAIGGDVVDVNEKHHTVSVNGTLLEEPYVANQIFRKNDTLFPLTVPSNHLFVMGDNRYVSLDSRNAEVGTVDRQLIKGRLLFLFRGMDS